MAIELPEAPLPLKVVRKVISIAHRNGYFSWNFGDTEKRNSIGGLKLARE